VSDASRLKGLEEDNAKLKKLLAEAMLDNRHAQGYRFKKMVTPAAKREAVAHLRVQFDVSERRACTVHGVDRTSVRYRSGRANDDAIRARLCALASIRRRCGYRRLHFFLGQEGLALAAPNLPGGTLTSAPS
jgi:putative transposase